MNMAPIKNILKPMSKKKITVNAAMSKEKCAPPSNLKVEKFLLSTLHAQTQHQNKWTQTLQSQTKHIVPRRQ